MQLLFNYAMSFVGTFYRWGGSNPINGFDCSGFIQEVLASAGLDPLGDQTAQELYNYYLKDGKEGALGMGALAFYGKSKAEITHIVLMLNDWQCIGANGGGSAVVDKFEASKKDAFVKIRPLDYRHDLVATVMPNYPAFINN